ncbi:MAG TPA: penicillin acylase family protein [Bryobacteraceae bacterium]|nr:penicillin acylase family protein [Bryobacteraceae bacterium]
MRPLCIVAVLTAALLSSSSSFAAGKTEILWDQYGVPHIFATDREAMFHAHGYAQMENLANLLLRLYGESRGRAAEYWGGDKNLELDRWLQLNGVPERAKAWYDAQDPVFRKYLDAFAAGINDYGKAHPDAIDPQYRMVLPVSGVDVVEHSLRAVHYMYMGSMDRMHREVNAMLRNSTVAQLKLSEQDQIPGSNTWTVGPSLSASGKPLLLINPHLAWGETFYRYMEVHLVAPDYDLFGTPQIGFPVPVVGFNRTTGWGRTVNTMDTVDFYKLTVKDGKYEFDGKLLPFEHETKTLKIKQPDGSFKEEKLEIRRSVQSPVVFDGQGVTVAMRVAGLDRPKMLEQWFRMGEAKNLTEFTAAMKMMSIPMWNADYADADGHIMLVDNGLLPRRGKGDYPYWSKVVPGDTSETLWHDYLTFDELPKSLDPASGWNQNTNEPPWTMTFPQLDRFKYPAYTAPTGESMPQMRTLRSLRLITQNKPTTYAQFVTNIHSTRMELADKVLPDLLKAAPADSEAAKVLAKWDHQTEVGSRGAVLFQAFADKYFTGQNGIESRLRVKYDPMHPLDSAYGLKDPAAAVAALESAAAGVKKTYGALDIPWGDVYRYAHGPVDVPGNGGAGGMGVFRTIAFSEKKENRYYAAHGETIVCAIEFSKPQQANCLLGYGNATQPGSKHLGDQLQLLSEKKLLPVWRDKKDVEAHLEKRETF